MVFLRRSSKEIHFHIVKLGWFQVWTKIADDMNKSHASSCMKRKKERKKLLVFSIVNISKLVVIVSL